MPGTPDETGLQAAVDERNRLADVTATLPTQGNLQELDTVLTQMRVDEARRDMMNSNTVVPDDVASPVDPSASAQIRLTRTIYLRDFKNYPIKRQHSRKRHKSHSHSWRSAWTGPQASHSRPPFCIIFP
eukprot:COSAG02_NODE_15606_length_1156_cov_1.754967_1_plen_129_part_00